MENSNKEILKRHFSMTDGGRISYCLGLQIKYDRGPEKATESGRSNAASENKILVKLEERSARIDLLLKKNEYERKCLLIKREEIAKLLEMVNDRRMNGVKRTIESDAVTINPEEGRFPSKFPFFFEPKWLHTAAATFPGSSRVWLNNLSTFTNARYFSVDTEVFPFLFHFGTNDSK